MSKYLNVIKLVACAVFGFMLAWNLKCSPKYPDVVAPTVSIKETVRFDTVRVNVPTTKVITTIQQVPVYLTRTDTIQAVANEFKSFVDNQTYRDSNVVLGITDTIFANSIKGAQWSYKVLRPVIYNQPTIVTHDIVHNKLLVGIQLVGNAKTFGAIPTIQFLTSSDHLYSAGFDVINRELVIGAYLKLHF